MTRICFIGNSHIAAMRLALQKTWKRPDGCEITLFGSHAKTLSECNIRDGHLISNDEAVTRNFIWTSGGQSSVDLDAYDLVCVLAGSSVFRYDLFWAPTAPAHLFEMPLHSELVVDQTLRAASTDWGVTLAQRIAAESSAQVLHVGAPFVSDQAPFSKIVLTHLDQAGAEIEGRLAGYKAVLHGLAAQLEAENLRFAPPPSETLEPHGLYTKHAYCKGSRKLTEDMDKEHPAEDFIHMNADYGAAVFDKIVACL